MIVLLDGLNKTGKSTLAKRLMADLPHFRYLHFDAPRDPNRVYQHFAESLEAIDGLDIILDRLHWSNAAFRDLVGGHVLMPFDHDRIDQWVAARPSAAVLLVDDPHAICQRVRADLPERPWLEPIATPATIGQIQNRFYEVMARSAITPKWSLGLDQLLNLEIDPATPSETYNRLVAYLRGETE